MNGQWFISGPREVTVTPEDHAPIVLKFNPDLTAYEGDRDEIAGHCFVQE
jgi:hypothetical protein